MWGFLYKVYRGIHISGNKINHCQPRLCVVEHETRERGFRVVGRSDHFPTQDSKGLGGETMICHNSGNPRWTADRPAAFSKKVRFIYVGRGMQGIQYVHTYMQHQVGPGERDGDQGGGQGRYQPINQWRSRPGDRID